MTLKRFLEILRTAMLAFVFFGGAYILGGALTYQQWKTGVALEIVKQTWEKNRVESKESAEAMSHGFICITNQIEADVSLMDFLSAPIAGSWGGLIPPKTHFFISMCSEQLDKQLSSLATKT